MPTLVVEREPTSFAFARHVVVEIDGVRRAELPAGGRLRLTVEDGLHTIGARVGRARSQLLESHMFEEAVVIFAVRVNAVWRRPRLALRKVSHVAPPRKFRLSAPQPEAAEAAPAPAPAQAAWATRQPEHRSRNAAAALTEAELQWPMVLGVPVNASMDEIRAAHRQRIREYHPDRFVTASVEAREEAERRARDINVAYNAAMWLRKAR